MPTPNRIDSSWPGGVWRAGGRGGQERRGSAQVALRMARRLQGLRGGMPEPQARAEPGSRVGRPTPLRTNSRRPGAASPLWNGWSGASRAKWTRSRDQGAPKLRCNRACRCSSKTGRSNQSCNGSRRRSLPDCRRHSSGRRGFASRHCCRTLAGFQRHVAANGRLRK